MSGPGPDRTTPSVTPSPGPAPSKPTPDVCLKLIGKRLIASPNPDALPSLSKGQALTVSSNGTSLDVFNGATMCGTVISDVSTFIECIAMGHEYVAIVQEVNTARCSVELRIK